jgi:hypothetical protein
MLNQITKISAEDKLPPYVHTSPGECVAIDAFPIQQFKDSVMAAQYAKGVFTNCVHVLRQEVRGGRRTVLGAIVRVEDEFHIIGVFDKVEDVGHFATLSEVIEYLQNRVNTKKRCQVRQLIAA